MGKQTQLNNIAKIIELLYHRYNVRIRLSERIYVTTDGNQLTVMKDNIKVATSPYIVELDSTLYPSTEYIEVTLTESDIQEFKHDRNMGRIYNYANEDRANFGYNLDLRNKYHIPIKVTANGKVLVLLTSCSDDWCATFIAYPLVYYIEHINYRGKTLVGQDLSQELKEVQKRVLIEPEYMSSYNRLMQELSLFDTAPTDIIKTAHLEYDKYGNLIRLTEVDSTRQIWDLQGITDVDITKEVLPTEIPAIRLIMNTRNLPRIALERLIAIEESKKTILSLMDYDNIHDMRISITYRASTFIITKSQINNKSITDTAFTWLVGKHLKQIIVVPDECKNYSPIELATLEQVDIIEAERARHASDIDDRRVYVYTMQMLGGIFGDSYRPVQTSSIETEKDYEAAEFIRTHYEIWDKMGKDGDN